MGLDAAYYIAVWRSPIGLDEAHLYPNRAELIEHIADSGSWATRHAVIEVIARDARAPGGVRLEDRAQLDREVEEYLADLEETRLNRAGLRAGAR